MLKEVRGGSSRLDLVTGITAASTSITIDGASLGNWPTGVIGPFVIRIEDELILCATRAGNTLTVASRGWDATAPTEHSASLGVVRHVIDADTIADLLDHVYDDTRDDHSQYLRTDGSRPMTDVGGLVDDPVAIGPTLAEGVRNTLARSDHVHIIPPTFVTTAMLADNAVNARVLGDNAVDQAAILDDAVGRAELGDAQIFPEHFSAGAVPAAAIADNVIVQRMLADNSIGTAEVLDLAVTLAKLAANLKPIIVCTAATRPTGVVEGQEIYETDTNLKYVYDGTNWVASVPRRLGLDVGPDRDVGPGGSVIHAQVTFTLTQSRLIKGAAHAQWSQVTGVGTSSQSCALGFDGQTAQRFVTWASPPVGTLVAAGTEIWGTLAAGVHTLDLKAINASGGSGAMRFTATTNCFCAVEDWGPA